MKKLVMSTLVGLVTLLSSNSCTNYYGEEPEGYVTQTVPVGYTVAMIAGISYWHHQGHYYRYWPSYGYVVVRPPHGRPPYQRPPNRPPGKPGKPVHPIERPPSGGRPPQGKPKPTPYPVTRPGTPTTRPSMPSTRPSTPSVQPRNMGGGGRRARR